MSVGTRTRDSSALWQTTHPFLGHPEGFLWSLGGTPQVRTTGKAQREGRWAGLEEEQGDGRLGRPPGVCKEGWCVLIAQEAQRTGHRPAAT